MCKVISNTSNVFNVIPILLSLRKFCDCTPVPTFTFRSYIIEHQTTEYFQSV